MSRVKPNIKSIQSLEDADQTLKEIAHLELEVERIDGKFSKRIGNLKELCAKEGKDLRDKINKLGHALSIYAEYNKLDLFDKKKTKSLSWGSLGFRKSTKIKVKRTTIELLKKLFPDEALHVKETVDKEILKDWDQERLAQIDAAKAEEDNFFFETNKDKINKELLEIS